MNIGDYNRYIVIEAPGQATDDWGHVIPDQPRVKIGEGWANIGTLRGKRFIAAGADVSKATVSISLHGYRNDLHHGMTVIDDEGNLYTVEAALPDRAGREFVDLACSEVGNA